MTDLKTVFGTVIYQEAWEFLDDFIESLNQQSTDFDILIINDNCTLKQVNELTKRSRHRVILKDPALRMSPAELRIELICQALDLKYDLLILGDFDDIFMKNRVERIQNLYSPEYTFFYNQLYDFNHKNVMRNIPQFTMDIKDIIDYNYLGLSNSALNLNQLTRELLVSMKPDKTCIFDWYFFSRLLLNGGKGRLVKDTGTLYRIHDNNIAGIAYEDVTGEKIKKEIEVKIQHYGLLQKYSSIFDKKLEFYQGLKAKIENQGCHFCPAGSNEFWWGLTGDCDA